MCRCRNMTRQVLQARRGSTSAQRGGPGHEHGPAGARPGACPCLDLQQPACCWGRQKLKSVSTSAWQTIDTQPGRMHPENLPACMRNSSQGCNAACSAPDVPQEVMDYASEEEQGSDPPRIWAPGANFPGTAFTRSLGDSGACSTCCCSSMCMTCQSLSVSLHERARGG